MMLGDSDVICRACGVITCEPPDELMEFNGLCPGCVVREVIFPQLEPRFRDLLEVFIESTTAHVVIASGDLAESFKKTITESQDARNTLRQILDMADELAEREAKKPKMTPVVRNDPRTS